jgi:hypothetical protein
MIKKQENIGVIFVLISAATWGIFPVLVNRETHNIPPITFAAITILLAACGAFLYAASKGPLWILR